MEIKLKGIVRYPHIFTPSAAQGATERSYSIQILVDKTDVAQVTAVTNAINAAIAERYPTGLPAGARTCWNDLAVTDPTNVALAGYMALTLRQAEAQGQPPVVDIQRQPLLDPAGIQPGDVVWVVGNTLAYTAPQQGVKTYLNVTMATGEKGPIPIELLSSRPSVDQMLTGLPGGTAAPAVAGMATPGAPPMVAAAPVVAAPVVAAPVAMAPAMAPPPVAAPVAAPVAPARIMTAAAQGATYDAMIAAGWTDETLVTNGMMMAPSFA